MTADDIRVLAQSTSADPVLALREGHVEVVPVADAGDGLVVYTKQDLLTEYGEELTDIEAQLAAASLTAGLDD